MRFSATIEQGGKTATGIPVPDEVVDGLGGGRRPAVQVGLIAPADPAVAYAYRTTVGQLAGRSMLPFSAEHRAASGVAAGDEVVVDLERDTAPREQPVPDDLAQALAAAPDAHTFFEGLAPGHRKEWVCWVEEAKKAETRSARIARAVERLGAGERRH